MRRINILTTKYPHSFIFPLRMHQKRLLDLGLDIRFYFEEKDGLFDCDTLILNNRCWSRQLGFLPSTKEAETEYVREARDKVKQLVWFDTSDSTGQTQFEVLPYVDRYYKSQVLADKKAYLRPFYANRIYADFYHTHNGVTDDNEADDCHNARPAQEENLDKIKVSWSPALCDHGVRAVFFNKVRQYVPIPRWYSARLISPEKKRPIEILGRVGTNYGLKSVRYQRERVNDLLKQHYGIQSKKISKLKYFSELSEAKVVISPFGWGDPSYKDYETFICGAALFKPDMSHMKTWPDWYQDEKTYVSHNWELTDFKEKLDGMFEDRKWLRVAAEGQEMYRHFLLTQEGHEEFCRRFAKMVSAESADSRV